MVERRAERPTEEPIKEVEPEIVREVLVRKGHALIAKSFDPFVVRNQEQFGPDKDDAPSMALAHEDFGEQALGVRVTTRRQFQLTVGREMISAQETLPKIVTSWISWSNFPSRMLTPDEARKTPHGGRTALDWATHGGVVPEMVVQAGGYYYPASRNDRIVNTPLKARR